MIKEILWNYNSEDNNRVEFQRELVLKNIKI